MAVAVCVACRVQIPEIEYAPMAMDVWTPQRHRDVELVVFGDGGGFVRLYELRLNPLVRGCIQRPPGGSPQEPRVSPVCVTFAQHPPLPELLLCACRSKRRPTTVTWTWSSGGTSTTRTGSRASSAWLTQGTAAQGRAGSEEAQAP